MVTARVATAPKEETSSIVVSYPVTPEDIESTRAAYAAITFDAPVGYAAGVKAIAHCRGTRGAIEARRKDLKADSIAYGRKVDQVAKELVALIESIESPLREKKELVDSAKARAKAEAEAAEKRALEAQVRAEREAEELRLREERKAEEARLAAERERLAAERAELAEQKRKEDAARAVEEQARKAEQAELNRQREKIDAERQALARDRARAETAARAEQERIAEQERQAEHARRVAALQPDLEKVKAFAAVIRTVRFEQSCGPEATAAITAALGRLARAADGLDAFVAQGEA
jgi:colicin import membrane protein/SWI/SNF-related matrix-associated actin-dependent regulator 1 of chromatin subfamily A